MPSKGLLFLTLNTFSSTGGIEKVCRVAGKALNEIAYEEGYPFQLFSAYDKPEDVLEKYVPQRVFQAFTANRLRFVYQAVMSGSKAHTVVLSHIHLLPIAAFIKLFSPSTRIILMAHGIEVWKQLPGWKVAMLKKVDLILPVSEFTKQKMKTLYGIPQEKFVVLNNCLDPFLQHTISSTEKKTLKADYGLAENDKVLFTLTRLSSSEQYKGYDRVIKALPQILRQHPNARYLIAGKYDAAEKKRVGELIDETGMRDHVIFTGFVPDEELESLFSLADLYIMPSTGEGFGIVFIEALFYGLPVIAGNADGSVDAVAGGRLGVLIDPTNADDIAVSVGRVLSDPIAFKPDITSLLSTFGFEAYSAKLKSILGEMPQSARALAHHSFSEATQA